LLAEHFFKRTAVDMGRIHLTIAERTIETLMKYSWPGNVRELRNVMERAVLLAKGDTIQPKDLRLEYSTDAPEVEAADDSRLTLREAQRIHIQKTLTLERGNIARAASRLGLSRSSLYNKINTYGIEHHSGKHSELAVPALCQDLDEEEERVPDHE
jgi:DNA-binding NtrC family response regulator